MFINQFLIIHSLFKPINTFIYLNFDLLSFIHNPLVIFLINGSFIQFINFLTYTDS